MADIGKMVLMRRKPAQVEHEGRLEDTEPTQEQPATTSRREPHHKPATFSIGDVLERGGTSEEQPAGPAEKELGFEEQISLRILAAAEWQDAAMRPRPGDVIYIPARRERLNTTDYLRMLLSILYFRRF